MRIRAGYRMAYDCPAPTPIVMMVNVRPERFGDLESPDQLSTEPSLNYRTYHDGFGNLCTRLVAPAGRSAYEADFIICDSGLTDPVVPDAGEAAVDLLPDHVLEFLLASRYCELDRFGDLAWSLFGQTKPGWPRVQAIVNYVHDRIKFDYMRAAPTKTAWQAHEERHGVCRDYAHLAVTLCRCMNIPARYCTGYLGDIGVDPLPPPMDFSAWFEAWLGGAWRTFDARHNRPRIGRVMMAAGRDAADVAIATIFGPADLVEFTVVTEALD